MIDLDLLTYSRLNDSSITALVGNRIYPVDAQQQNATMPFIVFEVNYGEPWHGIDKVYSVSVDNTIMVDCRDIHLASCKTIADAVIARLHGWIDRTNGIQVSRFAGLEKQQEGEYFHVLLTFKVVS